MKKIIFLMIIFFCIGGVSAADKSEEVMYQVNISIQYNEITAKEAVAIIADAMQRHKTACNLKIETKISGLTEIDWESYIRHGQSLGVEK